MSQDLPPEGERVEGPASPAPVAYARVYGPAQLDYAYVRSQRPGMVTAMGVMSIVVASLSLVGNAMIGLYGCGAYMMLGLWGGGAATRGAAPVASVATAPTTMPSTAPTTMPSTAPTTLPAADVQAVVAAVQAKSGNKLTAAQAATLRTILQTPNQQLVAPSTEDVPAAAQVTTAMIMADGSAWIQLNNGTVRIGGQGQTLMQMTNAGAMPGGRMPTVNVKTTAAILAGGESLGSFLLAVYLLVIGIMALRQSRRGGRLHLIYAWVKIPVSIVGGVGWVWVAQSLMQSVASAGPGGREVITALRIMGIGLALLGCAYPVGLVFALRSRTLREYYGPAGRV